MIESRKKFMWRMIMEKLFITELEIIDVRHLQNICIPLSKDKMKHLILTGKNGSGKTSVLEFLNDYFINLVWENNLDLTKSENIKKLMQEIDDNSQKEASKEEEKLLRRVRLYFKKIANYGKHIDANFNYTPDIWERVFEKSGFVLAYYGADRRFQPERPEHIEKVQLKEFYDTTEGPRTEFVKYLLDLKMTEALAVTNGKKEKAEEIKLWFLKLEELLQQIFEEKELRLVFDEEKFQFHIEEKGHCPFGFDTLSSGYGAVLDIVADLMMRMVKVSDKSFSFHQPGIVLIDEIETHLHLEMQKNIMSLLTTVFPNIQFIVTTHSPFILNSLNDTVIYDLENHVLVENGLANVPYQGIVEGYFNVEGMSKMLTDKFNSYKSIVQKEELTDTDFADAAKLEMFLDEIPDYLALDIAAEYRRLKLEFENREDC